MVLLDCIDSLFTESAPRLIQSISRDVRGMLCDVIMPLRTFKKKIFFRRPVFLGIVDSNRFLAIWSRLDPV